MKKGVVIAIVIAVVLAIAIGGYFLIKDKFYKTPPDIFNMPGTIQIVNFAFAPQTLEINAGDTVTWTNGDTALHTIASDTGSELSSGSLAKGESYSHTFSTAGTYDYHCGIHTSMKGTVIVK